MGFTLQNDASGNFLDIFTTGSEATTKITISVSDAEPQNNGNTQLLIRDRQDRSIFFQEDLDDIDLIGAVNSFADVDAAVVACKNILGTTTTLTGDTPDTTAGDFAAINDGINGHATFKRVNQYLSTTGAISSDDTNPGEIIATGDYSIAADDFYYQPGAGVITEVNRLFVHIKDTSGIDADKYGNNITLTNGVSVIYKAGGTEYDLTNLPIKTNAEWAAQCYDIRLDDWGAGNEILTIRWTFTKGSHGHGLLLDGDNSDAIIIRLNDNFTGLLDHRFKIEGVELTTELVQYTPA